MAGQSSIWKKEIQFGRRKPAAESPGSVWKKEITLGRRSAPPATVEPDAEWAPVKRVELWAARSRPEHPEQEAPQPPAVQLPAAMPVALATAPIMAAPELLPRNFEALDPRFRDVSVIAQLIEQRAAEYPGRVGEWRQLLPRLAERATDGVLPVELDGVVRTLFHELLHVGPNAPSGVEQKQRKPKRQRRTRSKPEPAAKQEESGLRREIHLPRPKLSMPKRTRSQPSEAPVVQVQAPPAPAEPKQSGLQREVHLPKLKLPTRSRGERPAKQEQPAKPKESGLQREMHLPKLKLPALSRGERPAKADKPPKAEKPAKPKQSGMRRELSLPRFKLPSGKLQLPSLDFKLRRGSGRSTQGTEKLVGLRIGSSQLAAALVHNNGSAELLQLARSPLDRGVVVGGEVRDADALARSLKAFFRQHKLPQESVRVGISNNRIGVRMLEVPAIDDPAQFENAVRFRTQEVLPIPIAEAVVDHVALDDAPDAEGKRRVLVVFAHKDLVDGYVDACRRAGLKLAGIDLDAFALLRALCEPPSAEAEQRTALVAVAIGHERTIFAVSDGRICDFTRVLEWGGVWLNTALELALDLSPEQAAEIKHSLSLSSDATPAGLSPVQAEAARAALRQEVQVLGRELLSSLQFYQSRPGSLDIGEILLSGGGAQLDGIDAELSRALGVTVRLGDPLGRVTLGKDVVRPADSGSLAIAVGLAIEEKA